MSEQYQEFRRWFDDPQTNDDIIDALSSIAEAARRRGHDVSVDDVERGLQLTFDEWTMAFDR